MTESVMLSKKEKTKVFVLAGFLGAGKTTLLRRILSWDTDLSGTVVIVNEFGDVGIDGSLLKGARSDIVELTSGCVCCTLRGDLMVTLKGMAEQFDPTRILIELTGIADPGAAAEVFQDPELHESMDLYKILTVLDADLWEKREYFGSFFLGQLHAADLILLNKIDTVGKDRVSRLLEEIHAATPEAKVVPTLYCAVDPETLWTDQRRRDSELKLDRFFRDIPLGRAEKAEQTHNHESDKTGHHAGAQEESGFVAFSFQDSKTLDENCFGRFTEQLPWELFRMKGPVRFRDRTVFVNHVGGKSEWLDWPATEETRLAFVGWDVRSEDILKKLRSCILQSEPEPKRPCLSEAE
jgi:G3E family GTPase